MVFVVDGYLFPSGQPFTCLPSPEIKFSSFIKKTRTLFLLLQVTINLQAYGCLSFDKLLLLHTIITIHIVIHGQINFNMLLHVITQNLFDYGH